MKILQINKFFYLRGGSERYFFEVSKILEQNGHEVAFFSMKHKNNLRTSYEKYFAEEVSLEKFSFRNILKIFYNFDAVKKLGFLIDDFQPDIAHLHNIDRQLGPAVINLLKKKHIPVIMTLHDYKLFCPKGTFFNKNKYCEKCLGGKYYKCLAGKCVKNSRLQSFLGAAEMYWQKYILKAYGKIDFFHAPSLFMKEIAVWSGIPGQKIKELVYPVEGVDNKTDLANPGNAGGYLLYFGRLSEEKGIETIIQALPMVKSNIALKVAGEGPLHQKLKKLIENQGLEGRATLEGFRQGDELKDLIKNATAVIIPSLWPENMPYALLEALASGKIVIASRVGGIPERISDKFNGYLFDPGNSSDLADKINMALLCPDKEFMENSSIESIAPFNNRMHYANMLKFYSLLLEKNSSSYPRKV